jgi:hypothetical protein
MMHLDVQVDDLDGAVADAASLGAELAEIQPQANMRVMFDPDLTRSVSVARSTELRRLSRAEAPCRVGVRWASPSRRGTRCRSGHIERHSDASHDRICARKRGQSHCEILLDIMDGWHRSAPM